MEDINSKDAPKDAAEPTPNPAPMPGPSGNDQYLAKVIKYIPAPIVAAYAAATGMIAEDPIHVIYLSWAVFFVCWVLAPMYVWFIPGEAQESQDCSKRFCVLAAILSFATWSFALGGPFALTFGWYRPLYGSLALILATLAMPLLEKIMMMINFFKVKS